MSRSTYYHRAGSLRHRESGRPEDALIAEAFAGSGGEYGCRKVAAALERRGVHMNFKTV
ncbi:MAG TPA: IS3 family transposase, partial [Candidatus Cryptobacteroides pullicola]|nr:IS3 family transposase [Candidatus Cryptobacteroides pullicola]